MNIRSIFKTLSLTAAGVLALLLTGCNELQETVLWSPDGRHGLVLGGTKIALVDETGAIVGQPFAAQEPKTPQQVQAWMPDSRRVLVVRAVKAKNWSECAPLLGVERAQSVIRAAEEMLGFLRSYRGDWEKFGDDDPRVKRWMERLDFAANYSFRRGSSGGGSDGIMLVVAYLRERHAPEIAPLLQTKALGEEDEATPEIYELLVRHVLRGAAPAEQVLLRSMDAIPWAQPAPDGRSIAFALHTPERPALAIIDAQGGEPVPVDEGVVQAAWTPDGQALVYQKTTVPFTAVEQQAQLGTLTRRQVRDAAGTVPAQLADAEDLAGILFSNEHNRVACLPDGRILFVSCELSLPAVETARELTLFAIRPGATRILERVVADAAQAKLPGRLDHFAVSPAGRFVALSGANGEVAVLSLESGEVTPLQGQVANYQDSTPYENSASAPAPTWRSASELCYIVAPGDPAGRPRRAEVVLRPLGAAPRMISQSWSDALTAGFLPRPKP